MCQLTHFDQAGRGRMVDVSSKDATSRIAVASGEIRMETETLRRIRQGGLRKGDVLAVADVAAIMGAKQTADWIPMCHRLMLSGVEVAFSELERECGIRVEVTVKCCGETGVEMEALTAVTSALLTIYDMCKAIDRMMILTNIQLEEKRGGTSGVFIRSRPNGKEGEA